MVNINHVSCDEAGGQWVGQLGASCCLQSIGTQRTIMRKVPGDK